MFLTVSVPWAKVNNEDKMEGTLEIWFWFWSDFDKPIKVSKSPKVNSSPSSVSSGLTISKQFARSSKISVWVPIASGTVESDFSRNESNRIVATKSGTAASLERLKITFDYQKILKINYFQINKTESIFLYLRKTISTLSVFNFRQVHTATRSGKFLSN